MKEFMTPSEYAEFAGITAKTITELKKAGFLPIIQVSKQKYLINVSEMMRDQEAEGLKLHETSVKEANAWKI